ncbi:protein of unknown function [Xenorhabdus poinarii G6]|uniref:Uncharacterized protein n=1 Tax=Xenorhabdus poinarii G6 TaxID=1354304 RepID=A0A068R052_9GAMM|nr:protein of unknown function [Xenorhabdus poinarii G6]
MVMRRPSNVSIRTINIIPVTGVTQLSVPSHWNVIEMVRM